MAETLKDKTAKGLFWSSVNSGATQMLNIIIGIMLGRLLSPEEYGIIGVLSIFTAIAGNLQNSGFSQGLINIKKPTANDYNSVFWFNIIVSAIIYLILFFCAPFIASFFHQPCLLWVSRFVFLSFFISSFGIAHSAYMIKNLMNREIAITGTVSLLCSGTIGIILAINGFSYWSLAWQQVLYISIFNLGRFYYCEWKPSFKIDFKPIISMFNFSVKILLTNLVNTLSNNILTLFFGRLFPIKDVGNFTQAYKWDTMASSLVSNAVGQVSQTIFVSVNDEKEREKRVFRKMLRFTAFLSFPLMFGLALVSNEFILITLTEKWVGSVVILQILCIGGAFLPFSTLYQNLIISKGKSDIFFWVNIFQVVLIFLLVFAFSHIGMTYMIISYTILYILWIGVWQYVAKKLIDITLTEMASDICPFMISAAGVMILTWFATFNITNHILLIISRIILATVLYFVIMKFSHVVILEECLRFIKGKRKS